MKLPSVRNRLPLANGLRWLLLLAAVALTGCETQRDIYVLTSAGKILGFDSTAPDQIDTEVSVSGLPSGESLLQIDYRPATDSYYCLTNKRRLCTVNPESGAVSLVSTTEITDETLSGPVIDFNPVADRLRLIASQQNLRINPNDGTLAATDTDIKYDNGDENEDEAPQLVAIAYDNNESGASSTTLYGLDSVTQCLVRIGSKGGSPDLPNTGLLHTVAELGTDFTVNSGLDIEPGGDVAWAALTPGGTGAVLYRIDLSDGSADRIDEIDDGDVTVLDLVVGPERDSNGSPS